MIASQTRNPREVLVEIALKLLDRNHPEDLSVREVARQAGLTSGAPYHHFGDKVGLLAACAEVAWSDLHERLQSDEDTTLEGGVRHKVSVYLDYALAHPGPYRLMTSRLLDDDERFQEVRAWRMRAMEGLVELIAQAAGPGGSDPKQPWRRAMAVWALLHGHATLALDGALKDFSISVLTEEVCRMAVRVALLPREESAPI